MAKLKDLSDWMTETHRAGSARTRSLVQIARKNGLFTVGGRGLGGADMTDRDASIALLLALYDGAPTTCTAAIEEFSTLPVWSVEVLPDGPRTKSEDCIRYFSEAIFNKSFPLPATFTELPLNPIEALRDIFSAKTRPFWGDSVTLSISDEGTQISIILHDLDVPTDPDLQSEWDHFNFTVHYGLPVNLPHHPSKGKKTQHMLTGDQLDGLFCLINGIDPEEDEDTDE